MKRLAGFILCFFLTQVSWGEIALSQFSIAGDVKLEVQFNGFVVNKYPKATVLVKSRAGIQTVNFKMFDVCGALVDECYEELFIKSGLTSDYQLIYDDCGISHLHLMNERLMYVDRFRKPDRFYKDVKIA